jgi:dihydroorotate dehydrogenase (NAD+) catalytic subunit
MARRRRDALVGIDARVQLGPLELPTPIVAASGTFGHADELARHCDPSRLGAVTAKSLAPYEWTGNPPPRLHMTPAGMLNAVGLQGPGVEHWVEHDLPKLRALGARVIASVWGRTTEEFGRAAKLLTPARNKLVAVEVNVSCPNLEDRSNMFAHSRDATAGATGLTLVNTVLGLVVDTERRRPVLGAGGGGLSGPAIKPIAVRAVYEVARAYPGVPIVGTGGVTTGADAVEMLLAGATAVGVGTATFHDPRAPLRVLDELLEWCATHGVHSVSELIGALDVSPRPPA